MCIRTDVLISLMMQRRLLWDRMDKWYKDPAKRQAAWDEIHRTLRPDFDSLTKDERENFGRAVYSKWTNLRDAYFRAEKIAKEGRRLGKFHKPYKYKHQLSFLSKSRRVKVCKSCISSDIVNVDKPEVVTKEDGEDTSNKEDSSIMASAAGPSIPTSEEVPLEYDIPWSNYSTPDRRMSNPLHVNQEENPHLLFFKGILPSVERFNEDETLELQADILAAIQQIRKERRANS